MTINQKVNPESSVPGEPADKGDPDPLIPVREEIVPGAYRYVFRRRSEISTNKP